MTTLPEIEIGQIVLLPPSALEPMAGQPRTEFDSQHIESLARNVMELRARGGGIAGTGYIDALSLRLPANALDANGRLRDGARLPIVSGENRWRAANYANEQRANSIPVLPCIIENMAGDSAFEIAYFANAFRADLTPMEEAQALLRIKNARGFTLHELASHTGKTAGYLQNRLDLIGADPDVLAIFDERPNAIMAVRRISTVKDPTFRAQLIEMARSGADAKTISKHITAKNAGLSVEKYEAFRQLSRAEKQGETEAIAARQTGSSKSHANERAAWMQNRARDIGAIGAAATAAAAALRGASLTKKERAALREELERQVEQIGPLRALLNDE